MNIKRIVILASGSGSNAENIVRFFKSRKDVAFPIILSNKSDAYIHARAKSLGIPSETFTREEFRSQSFVEKLVKTKADLIVLAGFLWLIPPGIIKAFPGRIINIHPALLPNYGGKGMYGEHVHRAVIDNGEKESGITIHYVNENYDEGNIIFQAKCPVLPGDTVESLSTRVHALEYEHFPKVIERMLDEEGNIEKS